MQIRTSLNSPLRINEIAFGAGRLGMTICPGKRGESVFGSPWERDLTLDLEVVRDWGAVSVVSVMEEHELKSLGVEGLGEQVEAHGMCWTHLPVVDLGAPDAEGLTLWRVISPTLVGTLEAGGRVLVHCRGGLGRTGMIAAMFLIERGMDVGNAIATVRLSRSGAIETEAQERFLWRYAQSGA